MRYPGTWTVEDKSCGVLAQDGCQMVSTGPGTSGRGVTVRAYAIGSPDLDALLSTRSGRYDTEVPLAGGMAKGHETDDTTGTALRYLVTGNGRLYLVDAEGARSAGDLTPSQKSVMAGLALP